MSEEVRGGVADKEDKYIDCKAGFDKIEVRMGQGKDGDENKEKRDKHKEDANNEEKDKDKEFKVEQGVRMGTSTGVGLYGVMMAGVPGRVYGDDICFML